MVARSLLPTLVALVVGIALGWFLSTRAAAPIPRGQLVGVDQGSNARLQASLNEILAILNDQEIEPPAHSEIRTVELNEGSAPQPQLSGRSPVGHAPGLPALSEQVEALTEQVEAMGRLVESLRQSLADGPLAASLPSLELLNQWPAEQNWVQLQQIIDEYSAGYAAGGAGVEPLFSRLRW